MTTRTSNHTNNCVPLIGYVLILMAVLGCSSREVPTELKTDPTVLKSLERYSREYVLVPGDQLEIAVYRNADVSRTVVIRADGNISLPLLDEIKASGLTPKQLDSAITKKLRARLRDPEVTVIVVNPMDPVVYVYGEVGAVKPVPFRQARTLAQALAYAGGLTRDASLGEIAIVRLDADGYLRMYTLEGEVEGQLGPYLAFQNTPLQADDLIVVPESKRSLAGRFITDFIVEPLSAVNLILTPYFQYRILDEELND